MAGGDNNINYVDPTNRRASVEVVQHPSSSMEMNKQLSSDATARLVSQYSLFP